MKTRAIRIAALSLAGVVGLTACSGGSDSSDSGGGGLPSTIDVTMVGDVSGFAAGYGTSYRQGAEIAIEEINASDMLGGSQLKLKVSDTGSDVKTAAAAVSAAARSDAVAVLGPTLAGEAVAVAPIAQQAKIPFLSDEGSTATQGIGDWVFNLSPDQANQMPALGKYIASKAKTVGIIYGNDDAMMTDIQSVLAKELKTGGATVTGIYGTPLAATDFTALATKVLGKSPDAIAVLGGGAMTPGVANQLRTSGFTGELYGNMGADGTFGDDAKNAEGFTYVTQWAPALQNAESISFVQRYDEKFADAKPIYPYVMDGYESVKFLALALAEAKTTDRDEVLEGLQTIAKAGFTSPSGEVTFGGKSGRLKLTPSLIVKYQNGEPVPQD